VAELKKCSCCGKEKPYVMIGGKVYCFDCAEETSSHKSGRTSYVVYIVLGILLLFLVVRSADQSAPASFVPDTTVVPTSTPLLDDPVTWALYAANKHMPKDMTLDTVEISQSVGERYLTIACNMDTMWDGNDYITAAADLICGVIPVIRDKQSYEHVTFVFYGPFVDKYGNSSQQLGIRAMYSRETLQKVNTEYFARYTRANPSGVIKAADTYLIHPAYTK